MPQYWAQLRSLGEDYLYPQSDVYQSQNYRRNSHQVNQQGPVPAETRLPSEYTVSRPLFQHINRLTIDAHGYCLSSPYRPSFSKRSSSIHASGGLALDLNFMLSTPPCVGGACKLNVEDFINLH